MLNTITRSVPTLSRPPWAPLNTADGYSLSSTNNNPFQTNTNLKATASPYKTLNQRHTAPNKVPSETLLSPSSTLNPIDRSPVIKKTILYLFCNEQINLFDHQYIPGEHSNQIDDSNHGEQPHDPAGYNQGHKKTAILQCFLSGIALNWFLKGTKKAVQSLNLNPKNIFFSQRSSFYAQVEAEALTKKKILETYVIMLWKSNN